MSRLNHIPWMDREVKSTRDLWRRSWQRRNDGSQFLVMNAEGPDFEGLGIEGLGQLHLFRGQDAHQAVRIHYREALPLCQARGDRLLTLEILLGNAEQLLAASRHCGGANEEYCHQSHHQPYH